MTAITLDHIHLRSADVEAAAVWYVNVFGARVTARGAFHGRVDLQLGGVSVFISPLAQDTQTDGATMLPRGGIDHLGLRVDEIADVVAALKAKHVEIVTDVTDVRPGVRLAFLRGPDDVLIELVERR